MKLGIDKAFRDIVEPFVSQDHKRSALSIITVNINYILSTYPMRRFTLIVLLSLIFGFVRAQQFEESIVSTAAGMKAMKVVDFDNDGDLDVLSDGFFELLVSEKRGDKYYTYAITDYLPGFPVRSTTPAYLEVAFGDMDQNGWVDIVVVKEQEIIVYYQAGFLNFEAKIIYTSTPEPAQNIELHDAEGDGDLDVIVVGETQLLYLKNDAYGIFTTLLDQRINPHPYNKIRFIDFDKDGDLDLVRINFSKSSVNWGNFDSENSLMYFRQSVNLFRANQEFIVGDFTGDLLPDIITMGTDIDFHVQNADHSMRRVYEEDNRSFRNGSIIDYNDDGVNDIVLVTSGGLHFYYWSETKGIVLDYVIENLGSSSSGVADRPTFPNPLDMIDMNKDGKKEIFSFGQNPLIYYGNGDFVDFEEEFILTDGGYQNFEYFDMDGDGYKDFLVNTDNNTNNVVIRNLGDNKYESFPLIGPKVEFGEGKYYADFDKDGDIDLIGIDLCIQGEERYIKIYSNEGRFNFVLKDSIELEYCSRVQVEVADFDSNGFPDIVIYRINYGLFVFVNNGNFDFEQKKLNYSGGIRTLKVLDFDIDGDLDILTSNGGSGTSSVVLFDNDNLSFSGRSLVTEYRNSSIDATTYADFNNDGYTDFIYRNNTGPNGGDPMITNLMLNSGNDSLFSRQVLSPFGGLVNHADFNLDGNRDVAVFESREGASSVYFGDTSLQFLPQMFGEGYRSLSDYVLDDEDNDGDTDIFYAGNLITYPGVLNYRRAIVKIENKERVGEFVLDVQLYIDNNANGNHDTNESFYLDQNAGIRIDKQLYLGGDARVIGYQNPFEFSLQGIDSSLWQINYDTTKVIQFPTSANNQIIKIGLIPKQPVSKIDFQLIQLGNRCDSATPFYLVAKNTGNQIIPTINTVFTFEANQNFAYSTPAPIDTSLNSVVHEFYDLQPGIVSTAINVLNLPDGTFLGEEFINSGAVDLLDDNGQIINTQRDTQNYILRCSYDPNDKLVTPSYGEEGFIVQNTPLNYTIRFQNTGNDVAFDVRIEDQLSPNLDLSTFTLTNSSHSEVLEAKLDLVSYKLVLEFNDINLPDSTSNPVGSEGFVSFTINPKPMLSIGTQIRNTGFIYFDKNAPIITNSTLNSITNCNELNELSTIPDSVSISDGEIQISLNNPILDSVKWIVNEELISQEESFSLPVTRSGNLDIQLVSYSPICIFTKSFKLFVEEDATTRVDSEELIPFTLFPNPTSGEITILGQIASGVLLKVWDVNGRLVQSERINNIQNKITIAESGVYFISFEKENGLKSNTFHKVVVLE